LALKASIWYLVYLSFYSVFCVDFHSMTLKLHKGGQSFLQRQKIIEIHIFSIKIEQILTNIDLLKTALLVSTNHGCEIWYSFSFIFHYDKCLFLTTDMLHSRKFFLNFSFRTCNSATSISWMGHSLEVSRRCHRRCTIRGGSLGSFCHMLLSPLCMNCSMRRVGRSTGRSGDSRSQKVLHQGDRGTMDRNHSMGSCWHTLWLGSSVHQRHILDHTLDLSFAQPRRSPLLHSFRGQCSSTRCSWLQQKYPIASFLQRLSP